MLESTQSPYPGSTHQEHLGTKSPGSPSWVWKHTYHYYSQTLGSNFNAFSLHIIFFLLQEVTRSPVYCLELQTASLLANCERAQLTRSTFLPWSTKGREAQCWSQHAPVRTSSAENYMCSFVFFQRHHGTFKYCNT